MMKRFISLFTSNNFKLRTISALIMAPIAIITVYLGSFVFDAAVIVAMAIALYEWLRMVAPNFSTRNVSIACGLLIGLLAIGGLISLTLGVWLLAVFTVFLFTLSKFGNGLEKSSWIAFGLPYIGGAGLALMAIRAGSTPEFQFPEPNSGIMFFLIAIVWASDVGAYLFGKIIGGRKLAPRISPNKTISGCIGGVFLAAVCGYAVAHVFGASNIHYVLYISIILSVVSQLGDLFESHMKRKANIKETGDLIPGHGGVLDRIDGLLFASVALFCTEYFFGIVWQ
ncbi:MAG: phosphatidate cytidylyltransferase [Alphaproteobacteria bacterium]|nr:phosphatidate cytidylyltransferase [Alphaproteobacteria bacterium]MCL2504892.1 phosphatidate cytidylyltransferase [Alphaproteobacteria bacterium]